MCHPHEASPDNGETTDNISYWRARRAELELRAVILLGVASATMSIVCGSIIVSGWFAGVLLDSWERVFWAGAVTAGVMIAVFAAAALPGGENARWACRRIGWLLRIGMLLFVLAPFLCILGLVGDFFQL